MFAELGNCNVCGQMITGSHYHCSCGTTDTTGMMGHHRSIHVVNGEIVKTEFHHCGPNGNCELEEK